MLKKHKHNQISTPVMVQKKDTLFDTAAITQDFVFNETVVDVFDDMLNRSVPYYNEVIKATATLLASFVDDGDRVVDLGCSTGTTLLECCRLIPNETIQYIGIDSSDAMLEKGRKKAVNYKKDSQISFVHSDITSFEMADISAFICNYTLQFIRPVIREAFLTRIFTALRLGGVLFLSEKTITLDPAMNRKYIDIYHGYKKEMGYSELEIAKKREALENVLIPFSIQENKNLLHKAGFSTVTTYFQWFNFISIAAVKSERAGDK